MYAIFVDGGRQYRVEAGQQVDIDYREDVHVGDEIEFDRVLAIGGDEGLKLGTPSLAGAKVIAQVLGDTQGEKIFIQKFRRRKNSKRRFGHRQIYTRVEIYTING